MSSVQMWSLGLMIALLAYAARIGGWKNEQLGRAINVSVGICVVIWLFIYYPGWPARGLGLFVFMVVFWAILRWIQPPTQKATLSLGFFPTEELSVRLVGDVPREYRVKVFNKNGTAHDVRVVITKTNPPIRDIAEVTLRPTHSPLGISAVNLGPKTPAYFNLLEYNPLDVAEFKPVMHITNTVTTAPYRVPVEDYEFTLTVYSKEYDPASIRVKFQRTYGPHSRMYQIDPHVEVSDKDPEVSAVYVKGALGGEGLAVVNTNPQADACEVTIAPFEFEGIAVRASAIELLPRGDKQFLVVKAIRPSDDYVIGDIRTVFEHCSPQSQWQLTFFLQYRDAWGKATFERSVTFDETVWLESDPRWTNVLPKIKLGNIIKRPLTYSRLKPKSRGEPSKRRAPVPASEPSTGRAPSTSSGQPRVSQHEREHQPARA